MPRPTSDVNGPAYQAILYARDMHRLYKSDSPKMIWVEETIHRVKKKVAADTYTADDILDLMRAQSILHDVAAKAGYDPNQPRVPAGRREGGRWADGGATHPAVSSPRKPPAPRQPAPASKLPSSRIPRLTQREIDALNRTAPAGTPPELLEVDPMFGLPRWYVGGAVSPTVSPLDFAGGVRVARAAVSVARVTAEEAASVVAVLRARYAGMRARQESNKRIRAAADAIEEFLGGEPDLARFKNHGDMVLIKDDKMIRFDIIKHGSGKGARPHFQIQRRISEAGVRKEKWKDIGQHWYDFLDSKLFMKE